MSISRPFILLFLVIAWCGFAASLVTHTATFWTINLENQFPYLWMLNFVVFLAAAPAIAVGRDLAGASRRPDYWKLALRYTPPIFRYATYVIFFYGFVNFFVCLWLLDFATPGYFHGQTALLEHGAFLRYLTAVEFQKKQAYEVRLFSGGQMIFFFISAAILTSAKNAPADFDRDVNVLIPPVGSVR